MSQLVLEFIVSLTDKPRKLALEFSSNESFNIVLMRLRKTLQLNMSDDLIIAVSEFNRISESDYDLSIEEIVDKYQTTKFNVIVEPTLGGGEKAWKKPPGEVKEEEEEVMEDISGMFDDEVARSKKRAKPPIPSRVADGGFEHVPRPELSHATPIDTSDIKETQKAIELTHRIKYYPRMRVNTEYPVIIKIAKGDIVMETHKGTETTETKKLGEIEIGKVLQIRLLSPAFAISPLKREFMITENFKEQKILFKIIPTFVGDFSMTLEFLELGSSGELPRLIDTTNLKVKVQPSTRSVNLFGLNIHLSPQMVTILSSISSILLFVGARYQTLGLDSLLEINTETIVPLLLGSGGVGFLFLIIGWFFGLRPFQIETDPSIFLVS